MPAVFSSQNRRDFNLRQAVNSENTLDLLQKAGYQILWFENDEGCKGVYSRVPAVDMLRQNDFDYYDGRYCYDGVLLKNLEKGLKEIDRHAVVLHTCDTNEIKSCPKEHIVNTYDNTILYTDYTISSAINILKEYPQFEPGLLYVSDHGESLGKNNIYLYGLPYNIAPDEQIKVPMLLWLSPMLLRNAYLDYTCLKQIIMLFRSLLALNSVF